jgi:Undecaprenyl-phosphate glucose phosphotransferase
MKRSMANLVDQDLLREVAALRRPRRGGSGAISHEVLSQTVQVVDFLGVLLSAALAFAIYVFGVVGESARPGAYALVALAAGFAFVLGLRKAGGYNAQHLSQLGWQLSRAAAVWAAVLAMLTMLAFVAKSADSYSRGWAVTWALLTASGLMMSRFGLRAVVRHWAAQGRFTRTVAVVGAGEAGEQLIAKLRAESDSEIVVVGVFDDRLSRVPAYVAGCKVLGTTDALVATARSGLIDEIVIALPLRAEGRIGEIIGKLRSLPVDLRLSIEQIGGFPMRGIGATGSARTIEILDRPLKHWSGIAKWLEDRLIGTLCLILCAPLMALIALAIRLDSPGPVLFVQDRFGFNNKTIRVFKFRTMHIDRADPSGAERTVRGDARVTRVGRILRNLSLDELPQLLNVLRGEMAMVGPRPHALGMKAGERLYHESVAEYFQRHRVRPGITGWAQVNGLRGEIDSLEKARRRVAFDLHYIDHWSLGLDLKILLLTLLVLFRNDNAY